MQTLQKADVLERGTPKNRSDIKRNQHILGDEDFFFLTSLQKIHMIEIEVFKIS